MDADRDKNVGAGVVKTESGMPRGGTGTGELWLHLPPRPWASDSDMRFTTGWKPR